MTQSSSVRRINEVRIGWMLVVGLALIGYAAIVAPNARRVASMESHSHMLYELANRNERMLASRGELEAVRVRVERDVARLAGENSVGKAALAMLRLLQREGQARSVVVSGFAPSDAASSADTGEENVTIALRGRYRDVVAVVAELSRHEVLSEVADVALTSVSGSSTASATVEATLHATLYHGIAAIMKENKDDVSRTASR